jgi:hypothetical protein
MHWSGSAEVIIPEAGSRFGSQSSWDELTQWQWLTLRDQAHGFPF